MLAGSLVAEGAVQLLETYALSLGLHLTLPDARFQPVPDLRTEVKVRGQITPRNARIEYRIDITELTLLPRLEDFALMDFHRAGEAIAEGRRVVQQYEAQIRAWAQAQV